MGYLQGMSLNDIACDGPKSDGSHPSQQAVSDSTDLANANGGSEWHGVVGGDAGRPRSTSSSLDKQITNSLFTQSVCSKRYRSQDAPHSK